MVHLRQWYLEHIKNNHEEHHKERFHWRRFVSVLTGLLETYLYSGTVLGFFHLGGGVMINQGFWCDDSNWNATSAICADRDNQEVQAASLLTIGIASLGIGALACGFLLDHLKTPAARYFSMILLVIGFICMSQAQRGSEWLVYIAQPCLGVGGRMIGMVNLRDLPTFFPKIESTVRTLAAGCLACSATVWWFARTLIEDVGGFFTLATVCYCLAGFSVFLIILRTLFFSPHETHDHCDEGIAHPVPLHHKDFQYGIFVRGEGTKLHYAHVLEHIGWKKLPRGGAHMRTYVLSAKFLGQIFWLNCNSQGYFYFVNNMWNWMGEKNISFNARAEMLNNTGWIILAGFGYSFLLGSIIDKVTAKTHRIHYALELVLVLTAIINIVGCFSGAFITDGSTDYKQFYLTYVMQIMGNCWTYSVNAAIVAILFPHDFFGRMIGISEATAGVMSFIPIIVYGNTDFTTSNFLIIGGVLAILSIVQALIVYVKRDHFHNNLFDKILGLHVKEDPEQDE